MVIYKIVNLVNNKIYIGKTVGDVESRYKRHWKDSTDEAILKCNYHSHLHNAMNKYGKDNFKVELVEDGIEDKQLLAERERYWIEFFKSYETDIGYNLTKGGEGGALVGDALERMRKSKTGLKAKPETIEKRKQTFKEIGLNLGSKNGMYGKDPWNKGKCLSDDYKESIRLGTIEGLAKSEKFQEYLNKHSKLKRIEYSNNLNYCKVCSAVLPFERRNLATCGSDFCKREVHKRKRRQNNE